MYLVAALNECMITVEIVDCHREDDMATKSCGFAWGRVIWLITSSFCMAKVQFVGDIVRLFHALLNGSIALPKTLYD